MRCLSLRSNKVPSSFKQFCSTLATAVAAPAVTDMAPTLATLAAVPAAAVLAAAVPTAAAVSAAALGTAGPRTMVVCSVLRARSGCLRIGAAAGATTCLGALGRLCGACERTIAVLSESDLSSILPLPLACWCLSASWLMMIEVCCDRSCLTAAGVTCAGRCWGAGRCCTAGANGAVVRGCSLAAPTAAGLTGAAGGTELTAWLAAGAAGALVETGWGSASLALPAMKSSSSEEFTGSLLGSLTAPPVK